MAHCIIYKRDNTDVWSWSWYPLLDLFNGILKPILFYGLHILGWPATVMEVDVFGPFQEDGLTKPACTQTLLSLALEKGALVIRSRLPPTFSLWHHSRLLPPQNRIKAKREQDQPQVRSMSWTPNPQAGHHCKPPERDTSHSHLTHA